MKKIINATSLDNVRIEVLGEGRAITVPASDIVDLIYECPEYNKKLEEIRELSQCPPDCDLLSWIKILGNLWNENEGGQKLTKLEDELKELKRKNEILKTQNDWLFYQYNLNNQ